MASTEKLSPTHRAAMDRLKSEGRVKWRDVSGVESRAFVALSKKGLIREVFQPYGHTYFELLS